MNIYNIEPFNAKKPTLHWFLGASTSTQIGDFKAFSGILQYIQGKEELKFPYNITLITTKASAGEIKAHAGLVKEGDAVFTACAGSANTECLLDELQRTAADKLKTIKHVMFHHYSENLFSKYPDRFKIAFLPRDRENKILVNQLKTGKKLASTVSTIVFDDSAMSSSNKSINPRVPYLLQPNSIPVVNNKSFHEQNDVKITDKNNKTHSVQKIISDPDGRCLFQYSLISAVLHSLVITDSEDTFITSLSQALDKHSMHIANPK